MKSHTLIFELAGIRKSHSWNVGNPALSNPYITFFPLQTQSQSGKLAGYGRAFIPNKYQHFLPSDQTPKTQTVSFNTNTQPHTCALQPRLTLRSLWLKEENKGAPFGLAQPPVTQTPLSPCHFLTVSTTFFLQLKYGLGNWPEIKIT